VIKNLSVLAMAVSVAACGIDQEKLGVAIDPADLLQRIDLEYRTYNLSMVPPYNTAQINVQGLSGTGEPIDAPVVYTYNPQYISITPDGLLTAVAPISSTPVIVKMTFGGATRVDTLLVGVISGQPTHLARVGLEPNPGDSAKITVGGIGIRPTKSLRVIREDSSGANVSTVLVSLRSSDPLTAKIAQSGNSSTVTPVRPGRVMLYTSTYAYGIGLRDSLPFVVGWPLGAFVGSYARFKPGTNQMMLDFKSSNVILGVGSCVVWFNQNDALDLDVVFDDPSGVASADSTFSAGRSWCVQWAQSDTTDTGEHQQGNIAPWRKKYLPSGEQDIFSQTRARSFPRVGVYRFRSSLHGVTGTIRICDEQNDQTCSPAYVKPWEVER
jgi:hypothetical protein